MIIPVMIIIALTCACAGLSIVVKKYVVHDYLGLFYIGLSLIYFLSVFIVGLVLCGGGPK